MSLRRAQTSALRKLHGSINQGATGRSGPKLSGDSRDCLLPRRPALFCEAAMNFARSASAFESL